MPWNAFRTVRNTLHVMNTDTGDHFEAADEDEANATIAAQKQAQEDAARAAEEAATHSNDFTGAPVGDAPTLRVN